MLYIRDILEKIKRKKERKLVTHIFTRLILFHFFFAYVDFNCIYMYFKNEISERNLMILVFKKK